MLLLREEVLPHSCPSSAPFDFFLYSRWPCRFPLRFSLGSLVPTRSGFLFSQATRLSPLPSCPSTRPEVRHPALFFDREFLAFFSVFPRPRLFFFHLFTPCAPRGSTVFPCTWPFDCVRFLFSPSLTTTFFLHLRRYSSSSSPCCFSRFLLDRIEKVRCHSAADDPSAHFSTLQMAKFPQYYLAHSSP